MHRFCVIILTLLVAISLPAMSDDKADITALLNDFLTTPDQGSYSNHDRFWAEDLIYTSSSGARFDKKFILDGIRLSEGKAVSDASSPAYHAEEIDIRLYESIAIVAFKLVAETPKGEAVEVQKFFNTGTFLKRDNKWQAVAWQATKIPAEE